MKKFFEEAEATMLPFETEDVICTSGDSGIYESGDEDAIIPGLF